MNTATAVTLDVRRIPPRNRHPLIFGIFHALPPGEALVLSNDHDPKPLYHHFAAESDGQFSWEYLQQGPELWQVRIGKTGAANPHDTGGCCGGACS